MNGSVEEVTQPISCNLCAQEFGDLQTYYAHARLTHLPSQRRRSERAGMPSSFDSQDATGKSQEMDTSASEGSAKRDEVGAEEQRHRRQLRRTSSKTMQDGGASGSMTVVVKHKVGTRTAQGLSTY